MKKHVNSVKFIFLSRKLILGYCRDEDGRRTSTSKESPRIRTASDSFLNTKPAQMSLSPSLHEPRKLLYVQTPSPNAFLGVSGESLASTSPESGEELGNLEKIPAWSGSGGRVSRTVSSPTGPAIEKTSQLPARSMSVVEDKSPQPAPTQSRESKPIEEVSHFFIFLYHRCSI